METARSMRMTRSWTTRTRQLSAGRWEAVAELAQLLDQVGAPFRLSGRGATEQAATADLQARIDELEGTFAEAA